MEPPRLVADVGGTNTRIALYDPRDEDYRVQRQFGYEDYRNRLS